MMEVIGFLLRVVLLKGFLKPFLWLFLGVKFKYQEKLDFEHGKIIIANHNSHVDALAILSCVPIRFLHKVHPVVARDYFYKTKLTRILAKLILNSVSVARNKEFKSPLAQCEKLLKKNHSLIIFPEGTRGKAGELQEFKHGVSILLSHYPDISILPVYCDGFGDLMPKGEWMVLPFNSSLHFGKSRILAENMSVQEKTNIMKQEILNLAPGEKGVQHV